MRNEFCACKSVKTRSTSARERLDSDSELVVVCGFAWVCSGVNGRSLVAFLGRSFQPGLWLSDRDSSTAAPPTAPASRRTKVPSSIRSSCCERAQPLDLPLYTSTLRSMCLIAAHCSFCLVLLPSSHPEAPTKRGETLHNAVGLQPYIQLYTLNV